MPGNGIGDTLLHLFRGRHSGQRRGEKVRSGAAKMHVSVVEARHHKVATKLNRLHAFLAATAIEQYVVQIADAADLPVGDGHGFGPGMRWIISVNPAVDVIDRVRAALLRAGHRLESPSNRERGERNHPAESKRATGLRFQRDFSSAIPEIPSTARSARLKPSSRPAESYHSCNEWAPPPLPPAPIAMASMPRDNGIFASVEERSTRDWLPTNSSAACSAASSGESGFSSPPGRLPRSSTFHSSLPFERSRADSISSRTPAAMDSRNAASRRASSSSLSERMSTLRRASCGTEFTDVPPSIWPMLKVVRGVAGTFVLMKRTEPRTSALIGLGMPKSDQLCPPGPVISASSRREASAFVVTWSVPEPSRTTTALSLPR